MKILHTADFHLGAYVGPQCDDPMKRMENTIECLITLVETATREKPDIILVAGDIFHSARVWDERRLVEVRTAANYLNALGTIAPVVVLYGTPSHENLETFYTLQELVDDFQVTLYTEPFIRKISTKSGPIQIAGLPGFDKGHFRAQFPGLSAEEENQIFTEQLSGIVAGLSAQIDSTIPSVLMAHHTVVGCELDNGTHIFQANEVVLDAATLDNSAFDLVCLGHIHKAQKVEVCSKPVYYAGSIDADRFNDEGHQKGFFIHDMNVNHQYIDGGYAVYPTFIKTPAREFFTLNWEKPEIELYNSSSFINQAFKVTNALKDKVVRVLYTCDSETEKALDKKKLERDLYATGAYYVSEIRPESITAAVNRDRMHEKLTVEDCLTRYLMEKGYNMGQIAEFLIDAMTIIAQAQASSPIGTTSGLFLPVEIEVRNYRSYAEEKLSFEDIFFAMVNGKNGSGKSSLFMDAIGDCLYEETREKELTGWIRNGEKSGSISFTFRLGDDAWRVTRTRQRSGNGTLALSKFLEENNINPAQWIDHAKGLKMPDIQKKIVDLLGMDCDTFQSCVLIMQDRYGKFMEASKEDRMNVLASLLGLGIYDELEKLAKDKLTEVNRSIKALKLDIEELEYQVSTEGDLRTEAGQVEVQLSCANDDLKAAREELAGYQAQLTAIEGYVREIETLSKEVDSKLYTYNQKKGKKTDLENRVSETESFLLNEQNILAQCAELDSTRLEIAGMDGKLKMLEDKRLQYGKANRELASANMQRKSITDRLVIINSALRDRERLEAIVNGNTVEVHLEECEKKAKEYLELDNVLDRMEQQGKLFHKETQATCDIKNAKLAGLKNQVEMLDSSNCIDVEKAQCKFLQSAKLAAMEANKLELEIETYIAERTKIAEATGEEFAGLEEKIRAVGYDSELYAKLQQQVKTYRDAKDKLAKMAADSATADALTEQDAELNLKITYTTVDLKVLTGEIEALEQETSKYNELAAKVNSLLKYENLKMQLPKAKQFVESANEQIVQLVGDLAGLTTEIEKGNERLTILQNRTLGKDETLHDVRFTEASIGLMETDISTLNQSIGTIKAKLEVIVGQKVQLTSKQSELSISAKQAAQLQLLVEAFSQDGIPYQIIRDIVPELEAAANEILGQMTGGRMRLEFVTEKVLKSNKAKEISTLEIIIIDVDNGILPYLSRSGGQKVRAALANSFALAMIKASRVGLQLGMLFIDEPSFLDADGIEGYCAALETIHNRYPEMRILAISHDENMKSRFPQQLYVDITENGSRVRRL